MRTEGGGQRRRIGGKEGGQLHALPTWYLDNSRLRSRLSAQIEYGPDYGSPHAMDNKESLVAVLEKGGVQVTLVDTPSHIEGWRPKLMTGCETAQALPCNSDSDVGKLIRKATGAGEGARVVWAQIGRVFDTLVEHAKERVDERAGTVAPLGEERKQQLCRSVTGEERNT